VIRSGFGFECGFALLIRLEGLFHTSKQWAFEASSHFKPSGLGWVPRQIPTSNKLIELHSILNMLKCHPFDLKIGLFNADFDSASGRTKYMYIIYQNCERPVMLVIMAQ